VGWAAGLGSACGVVVVSGAHVSIAPAAWGLVVLGGSFRRRMSKESRQAARRKPAPAGAKGWLGVSMCQIASVSLLESSIWATLGPRWRPSRPWCAGSAPCRAGACRRSSPPRTSPNVDSAARVLRSGRAGRSRRTGSLWGTGGVAAELVADLRGDGERVDPAEPRRGDQQRDVAMVGPHALELHGELGDLRTPFLAGTRPRQAQRHGCPKVISVAWMRFFSVVR